MLRSISSLAILFCLAVASPFRPESAWAGPVVSGTTTCSITAGMLLFRPYLPLLSSPALDKPILLKAPAKIVLGAPAKLLGTCDPSGVVGAAVVGADVHLSGAFAPGSNCQNLVDSVSLEKTVLKVRWTTVTDGHPRVVGTSRAPVTNGAFDSGLNAFVLTTAPLTKGPFLGSTLTLQFPIGDLAEYNRICSTVDGGFSALQAGSAGPWTLEVH